MTRRTLNAAIAAAQTFLAQAKFLIKESEDDAEVQNEYWRKHSQEIFSNPKEHLKTGLRSGSVRRASMDLTRSLAELRKP